MLTTKLTFSWTKKKQNLYFGLQVEFTLIPHSKWLFHKSIVGKIVQTATIILIVSMCVMGSDRDRFSFSYSFSSQEKVGMRFYKTLNYADPS